MRARAVDAEIQGFYCPLQPPEMMQRRIEKGKCRHTELGFEKYCGKCNEYWPMDTEYWFAARGQPDGLFNWCRACYVAYRWPEGRSPAPVHTTPDLTPTLHAWAAESATP